MERDIANLVAWVGAFGFINIMLLGTILVRVHQTKKRAESLTGEFRELKAYLQGARSHQP